MKVWLLLVSVYMADGSIAHYIGTAPPNANTEAQCEIMRDDMEAKFTAAPETVKVKATCGVVDISAYLPTQ